MENSDKLIADLQAAITTGDVDKIYSSAQEFTNAVYQHRSQESRKQHIAKNTDLLVKYPCEECGGVLSTKGGGTPLTIRVVCENPSCRRFDWRYTEEAEEEAFQVEMKEKIEKMKEACRVALANAKISHSKDLSVIGGHKVNLTFVTRPPYGGGSHRGRLAAKYTKSGTAYYLEEAHSERWLTSPARVMRNLFDFDQSLVNALRPVM